MLRRLLLRLDRWLHRQLFGRASCPGCCACEGGPGRIWFCGDHVHGYQRRNRPEEPRPIEAPCGRHCDGRGSL